MSNNSEAPTPKKSSSKPKRAPISKEVCAQELKFVLDKLRKHQQLTTNLIDALSKTMVHDVSFTALEDSKKLLAELEQNKLNDNVKGVRNLLVERARQRMKEV